MITLPGFDGRAAAVADEKSLFAAFVRLLGDPGWGRDRKADRHRPQPRRNAGDCACPQEHPDRLSGVVAADGLPVFPMLASRPLAQCEAMASQMAERFASLTPAERRLAVQKNYMSTIGTNRPELIEPAACLQARSDPKAVAAWLRPGPHDQPAPNLGRVTIPLLEIMPYDPADANRPPGHTQEQTLAFYESLVAGGRPRRPSSPSPPRGIS